VQPVPNELGDGRLCSPVMPLMPFWEAMPSLSPPLVRLPAAPPVLVLLVFGSWCSGCKLLLSAHAGSSPPVTDSRPLLSHHHFPAASTTSSIGLALGRAMMADSHAA
jgi:hypothetical protein